MRVLALAVMFLVSSCAVQAPINLMQKVGKTEKNACLRVCSDMGMNLSSVVIVRGSAGCVCNLEKSRMSAANDGGAASATGTILTLLDEEQQKNNHSNSTSNSSSQ